MAAVWEGRSGEPGRLDAPVERPEDHAVPPFWLNDREIMADAERVDRLAADADLITSLALAGYDGPAWKRFSTELARYGIAVVGGWMRRGLILGKCRERGMGGLPPLNRQFTDDEVASIAGETVAKALVHFRADVLIPRRWDPDRGATLRTYFIGQCLIRFANIYRRWWGQEVRNRYALPGDDRLLHSLTGTTPSADGQAVDRVHAQDVLDTVKDPRVRRAMRLTARGLTQAEIASDLDVTEKTVERMLANERTRLRQRRTG